MTNDESARHLRAARLRTEIAGKMSGRDALRGPEQGPDESPLEYVERRARELADDERRGSAR